jgi:predicted dehydrogenase
LELVGVCDLSPITAEYAAAEYQAGAAYTYLSAMLDEARPDVVHVLTPPETHEALVTACLQAGAHVICEKPITTSAPQLQALLDIAATAGRHLMESHNYRFNPEVVRLREAIDEGRLGTVRETEIRVALPVLDPAGRFGDPHLPSTIHQLPAGVIHDLITHMAYLAWHLTDANGFQRVAAAWSNHSDNDLFRFDNLDALLIGSSPQGPVHARLRFDAGAGPDTFTIVVRGSEGWIETDLFQPFVREVRPRAGGAQLSPIVNHMANGVELVGDGLRSLRRKVMQQSPYVGLHQMLNLTYTALIDGGPLPVSPTDMVRTASLIDDLLDEGVRL